MSRPRSPRLTLLAERVGLLRSQGLTEATSPELARYMEQLSSMQALQKKQRASRLVVPSNPTLTWCCAPPGEVAAANAAAATTASTAVSSTAAVGTPANGIDRPGSPIVQFTPTQLASLRCQMMAYRLLTNNLPLTPDIALAIASPEEAVKLVAREEARAKGAGLEEDARTNGDTVEPPPNAEQLRDKLLAAEPPVEEVEDRTSLIYPYNSFSSPQDVLFTSRGESTLRTLAPTLFPVGLDPQTIVDERNRYIEARIHQRMSELESLPSNLAQDPFAPFGTDGSVPIASSQKLKALIELKSLNLLARQKALREDVVRGFNQASSLMLATDRAVFRRAKKQNPRDARATEAAERTQKVERERRAKQKHLDHLTEISTHGRDLNAAHRAHQAKFVKLGKALVKFHSDAEKDEQRRVERVSKERLKALRADDEEGYLKLIDTAKDTRITHLLRQTDAFLDSLATAVVAQQNDAVHSENPLAAAEPEPMQVDEVTVDESRFGAVPVFADEVVKDKVDYYNVAHRIKETITEQPKMLVGGQLKSYQIKGLEWMISLYNNHVNGILADEMVSSLGCSQSSGTNASTAGTWENDPDHLPHHVPHRNEEAERPLPRHRPPLDDAQLDHGV